MIHILQKVEGLDLPVLQSISMVTGSKSEELLSLNSLIDTVIQKQAFLKVK